MNLPERKRIRLKNYNYASCGTYFITICAKDRRCLFGHVGATSGRPQITLSPCGETVDRCLQHIPLLYPAVSLDLYCIMPNHLHLLLQIKCHQDGRPMVAPTVSTMIQQLKGVITKQIGFPVFQRSFYDHVVRNDRDYREIAEYIQNNPLNWEKDVLFLNE